MRPATARRAGWAAVAAAAGAAAWWYGDQAPYPYGQRWLLDVPLPFLTQARLTGMLAPRPGERILEIGPGTGLQALRVAPLLGPGGRLDVVDVQPAMLQHVARRTAARRIGNIVPACADARALPFADATFDAVYVITALGEIPGPRRVLAEAARVLAPRGRIVIGEFLDRHWIPLGRLHRHADACGLHLDARSGPTFAYLARFRPCGARSGPVGVPGS